MASNTGAAQLCQSLGCELEEFAEGALPLFTSKSPDPLTQGVWRQAESQVQGQVIPLRAQYLSAGTELMLLVADLPADSGDVPVQLFTRKTDTIHSAVAEVPVLEQMHRSNESASDSAGSLAHERQAEKLLLNREIKSQWLRPALQMVRLADKGNELMEGSELAHLKQMESIARVGSYRLDLSGSYFYVSSFLSEILGHKAAPKIYDADDLLHFFSERDAAKLRDTHLSLFGDNPIASTEVTFSGADGTALVLEVRCKLLRDPSGRPSSIYGAILDMTHRVSVERKVRFMAYHDSLTELPNRAMFMEEAQAFLVRAQQIGEIFALHMIDLDGFKAVNDRLGHLAGDRVLQVVAERVSKSIRGGDIAFRLGGDEFAVLHRSIQSAEAVETLGVRLVAVISEPFKIGAEEVAIGASLGGALYAGDESVQHMILRADEMLYAVKRSGKGAFRLAG